MENIYTYRIGRRTNPRCDDCQDGDDSPRHTVFECRIWIQERESMNSRVRGTITEGNIIQKIMEKKENWKIIQECITRIMMKKEDDERRRKCTEQINATLRETTTDHGLMTQP